MLGTKSVACTTVRRHNGMSLAMRVVTGGLFVWGYLLLQIQFAVADGIGGWPLLHWEMSKQQVERAYPNFEHFDHIYPIGTQKVVFGLASYFAAGCTFSVILDFLDNKLMQISLESTVIKKGSYSDRLCHARDALSKLYGQPEVVTIVPTMPILKWVVDDTEVSYSSLSIPDDWYEVSITYSQKGYWERKFLEKRL
jgi:hypothetical protein